MRGNEGIPAVSFLTCTWPHLRCDVGLEEEKYCYSIVYYYNGAQRYERSTVSGFDLVWFSSLSSKHLCVFGLHGAVYIIFYLLISFSLPFSELSLLGLALDLVD